MVTMSSVLAICRCLKRQCFKSFVNARRSLYMGGKYFLAWTIVSRFHQSLVDLGTCLPCVSSGYRYVPIL